MRWTMPGRFFAADAGETVAAVVQQGVDERAVRVTGSGVDDKAGRLVDHDHVPVLIHHVQRNVLGFSTAVSFTSGMSTVTC